MSKTIIYITCTLACAAGFVLQIVKAFPTNVSTPLHLALAIGWLGVTAGFACVAIRDILDNHNNNK